MLSEFNRIAREMLFLHGHLTRPEDWAQNAHPAPKKPRDQGGAAKRARQRIAVHAIVMPARFIAAQIR